MRITTIPVVENFARRSQSCSKRGPIVEEEKDGRRRVLPNKQGVPQDGVISPLLANLYLNALDWAVNDPKQRGRPVMVRYADDFVILCAPGQGTELVERLRRWLAARGLKLNEQKTRRVHSRESFQFLTPKASFIPAQGNALGS